MALRLRAAAAVILLVLVAVLAPLSVVARWTHTHMSDTDGYLATVAPLARDPAIRTAIADRVTAVVTERIQVPGLEGLVRAQVTRFVDSDAFAALWTSANREAHRQLVGVFTGAGTRELDVSDGTVSVSLAGVSAGIRQSLVDRGIAAAAVIPTVEGSFTIFESAHIVSAQRAFRLLDRLAGPLPFVTAVLLAAAIAVARRRLVVALAGALCVAAGMGLLAIALAVVRSRYLAELPQYVSTPALRAVFDALAAPMLTTLRGWLIAGLGAAVVLAALRIGWTRIALRHAPAPGSEA